MPTLVENIVPAIKKRGSDVPGIQELLYLTSTFCTETQELYATHVQYYQQPRLESEKTSEKKDRPHGRD